ncbi:MAG: glycosyltransferase [Verrucomicrobiae bacterium]|nr:glycosyltransferase [Verrucomicrobiae bacterium]
MTQKTTPNTFYLTLPCYNEGERLAQFLPSLCTAILKSELSVRVQIVDDGSDFLNQGHYRSLMELLEKPFPFLLPPLTLEENQGKGAAVYSAWRSNHSADFLAFADADGAVGPEEVLRVFRLVNADPEAAHTVYTASRIHTEETEVHRRIIRNLGGHTFRWLRKRLFSFPIEDTQCGFKVIPAPFFHGNEDRLTEPGFAFDIELLYRAQQAGLNFREVPVNWEDKKGGHMNILSSAGLFKDLLRLKGRLDKEEMESSSL